MIEVVPLYISLLEKIIKLVDRSSLEFFEYKFLSDNELKAYLYHTLENTIQENGSNTLVAIENYTPIGFVSIIKNDFDSLFFGFPCFQLTINIFSSLLEKVNEITKVLTIEVENYCKQYTSQFYIYLSLNNNTFNCQPSFNSLISSGYYFITTLLTFSLIEKKNFTMNRLEKEFNIREARPEDVDAVSALAKKSFQYSRFHLDPFLDNEKANLLLKTSAENSILRGFVEVMFVAEHKDKIVGYYSGEKQHVKEFDKTIGTAVISAVDSKYQGLGIFTQLDNYLLDWFSNKCSFAEMGTYLGNFPVHKTWIGKNLGLIRGTYQFSKFFNSSK